MVRVLFDTGTKQGKGQRRQEIREMSRVSLVQGSRQLLEEERPQKNHKAGSKWN